MNDRLDIPGVPPDWPQDPAASALAPEWFRDLAAERAGVQPIIAISTADAPGSQSICDGRSVMEQVAQLYRHLDDLPPAIERISVHPGEINAFVASFPQVQLPWPGFSADALLSVPICADPKVPPNTVRVRRGGEERDHPMHRKAWMWPKGYEQPDAAVQVSTDPDIFRSAPLRRIPWWRRWAKLGRPGV